jgi:hypothetical protein
VADVPPQHAVGRAAGRRRRAGSARRTEMVGGCPYR